ncbi:MAG: class I SAM-dependent methyltransferase [Deltaproteobacteria bacterium]|nr:class I SAM-dependent methyltransferase [Deltaproteobacteria bacterium]
MKGRTWQDFQRRHFDEGLPAYEGLYGGDSPFHRAMARRVLAHAGVRAGMEVLDVGCGLGRLTLPLLAAGCRVTGLDISGPTLSRLRARVGDAGMADRFAPIEGSVESLDLRGRFDLVTGRGVMHHIKEPAAVLRRVHRALKPDGRAVFVDPNPLQPAWGLLVLLHPALSIKAERYLWRGTPSALRKLLLAAGFGRVAVCFMGMVPPPLWGAGAAADSAEDVLEKLPAIRCLGLYVVVSGCRSG